MLIGLIHHGDVDYPQSVCHSDVAWIEWCTIIHAVYINQTTVLIISDSFIAILLLDYDGVKRECNLVLYSNMEFACICLHTRLIVHAYKCRIGEVGHGTRNKGRHMTL